MTPSTTVRLHELGQSTWLDNINDGLIQGGTLARLIAEGSVYGVTSNPTIFKNAIGGGHYAYPTEIARLASEGKRPEEIYDSLAVRDITRTADLLRAPFEGGTGRDGFVSLEVPPALSHDTAGTVAEAKRLWKLVARPNLLVKVPATAEGIPAVEALIADGVSVNVTLIFSRRQYAEVAAAHRRGIERRLASGGGIEGVHSVASVFVSRVDTSVDREVDARVTAATGAERSRLVALRGRAAVANALDIWEEYRARYFAPDFGALRGRGARPQWLLWASTGTKDRAYSDVKYVEELMGPDSVNTMPMDTLEAWLDHGVAAENRLESSVEAARRTRRELAEAGISLDDHCDRLLVEGVRSFAKSFDEMMAVVRERSAALAPPR